MLWLHLVFIVAFLAGLLLDIMRATNLRKSIASVWQASDIAQEDSDKRWLFYLLTTIGWPPLIWLTVLWSLWTPVGYMLFPPEDKQRDKHLSLDVHSGVHYPKQEAKNGPEFTVLGRPSDHLSIFVLLHSAACFVGSWYI